MIRAVITILQVCSLLTCCTGIVLVSLFSAPDQSDIKPNTTFTDNLLDVHPTDPDDNKGSVLGYIVSITFPFVCSNSEVLMNCCSFFKTKYLSKLTVSS